jgi:DNA repair protein RadA/Sms
LVGILLACKSLSDLQKCYIDLNRIIDPGLVLIGEVGLGGQIRPVSQMELRLKEAAKLGFKRAIVPKGQKRTDVGMDVIEVGRVVDAIATALANSTQQEVEVSAEDDFE